MIGAQTIRVALFAITAGVVAAEQQQPSLLVDTGRVGILEVGAPAEDVYRIFGRNNVKLVDLNLEGYFTLAMEVRVPGAAQDQPNLVIRVREFPCPFSTVESISVNDRRYRTERGLGIGSTVAELQRVYRVKKWTGEGSAIARVEDPEISFGLAGLDFSESSRVVTMGVKLDPDVIRQRRCPR